MLADSVPVTIHCVGTQLSVLGLVLRSLNLSLGLSLAYQRLGLEKRSLEYKATNNYMLTCLS